MHETPAGVTSRRLAIPSPERLGALRAGRVGVGVLSTGASGTSANDIRALIAQREQARGNKDWVTSDRIREDLRAKGVEVLDKERLWKSSDGSVGIIDPANGAAPTDEAITSLVGKREEARTMRDWATSTGQCGWGYISNVRRPYWKYQCCSMAGYLSRPA